MGTPYKCVPEGFFDKVSVSVFYPLKPSSFYASGLLGRVPEGFFNKVFALKPVVLYKNLAFPA